jgi:hypothetical protein
MEAASFLLFIPIITIITILIIYYHHYHHYNYHYHQPNMPKEEPQSYPALFGGPPSQVGASSILSLSDVSELENPHSYLSDNVIGALIHLYRRQNPDPKVVTLDPQFLFKLEYLMNSGQTQNAQYLATTTQLEEKGPYEMLLMPFNIFDNHWVLVTMNRSQRAWTILDSLRGTGTSTNTQSRVKRLLDNLLYKWWGNPTDPRWTYVVEKCALQRDGSNCALHVIENLRHLQKFERPDLTPINGHALRQSYLNALTLHGRDLLPWQMREL